MSSASNGEIRDIDEMSDMEGRTYHVISALAPIHRRRTRQSPLETQLLYGGAFFVERIGRGWAQGYEISPIPRSPFGGYRGYVPMKSLRLGIVEPTHCVMAMKAPLFKKAEIKSRILDIFSLNAQLVGEIEGDFLKLGRGYIHKCHIRSLLTGGHEQDFVSIAENHIGLPYIWGGISSDGLDCSGLVQTALRAVGRDAPRDSKDQAHIGEVVDRDSGLKRGDLVFWAGHVGIMRSPSELLHANGYHMCVKSEPLKVAEIRIMPSAGPIQAIRRLK